MNTKGFLSILLALSLCVNVYLFWSTTTWQKAWLAQILTTSEIENLFRKSDADISFQSIQEIVQREYKSTFKVLSKQEAEIEGFGPYENVIVINETKLLFNENRFIGSKANLPSGIEYWWFNQ